MLFGHARDDLAPQPRGLEDVRLVDARHARAREAEGDLGDALDLPLGVDARVVCTSIAPAPIPEVDAAGELAHHQQVGALDALALQRTRVEQRARRAHGAQVRVEAESLAQPEEALLGARGAG